MELPEGFGCQMFNVEVLSLVGRANLKPQKNERTETSTGDDCISLRDYDRRSCRYAKTVCFLFNKTLIFENYNPNQFR